MKQPRLQLRRLENEIAHQLWRECRDIRRVEDDGRANLPSLLHTMSSTSSLPSVTEIPHASLVLWAKYCSTLHLDASVDSGGTQRAKRCCFCQDIKDLGPGSNDNSLIQHMRSKKCRQVQRSLGNPLLPPAPSNNPPAHFPPRNPAPSSLIDHVSLATSPFRYLHGFDNPHDAHTSSFTPTTTLSPIPPPLAQSIELLGIHPEPLSNR